MEVQQQQKVVKKSRSHLLRHELPSVDLEEAFGTTDGREIAKDIARWGQKELQARRLALMPHQTGPGMAVQLRPAHNCVCMQAKFNVVYGTPTFSNNNNWLRRKLLEGPACSWHQEVSAGWVMCQALAFSLPAAVCAACAWLPAGDAARCPRAVGSASSRTVSGTGMGFGHDSAEDRTPAPSEPDRLSVLRSRRPADAQGRGHGRHHAPQ